MAGISQFTSQQVLEAGRRAEADGKRDYAIQFYAHVAKHHQGTAEAAEATEALHRLESPEHDAWSVAPSQPAYGGQQPYYGGPDPVSANHAAPHPLRPTTGIPLHASAARTQRPQPYGGHTAGPAKAHGEHATGEPTSPKTLRGKPHRDHRVNMRTKPKRYRLGRFMAALLGAGGFVVLVAGLVAVGSRLTLMLTKANNEILALFALSPAVAAGLVVAASLMILFSQMARATFDAAMAASARSVGEEEH